MVQFSTAKGARSIQRRGVWRVQPEVSWIAANGIAATVLRRYVVRVVRSTTPRAFGCPAPAHIRFLLATGFSLVETALALGIVSFAFVALIGLLPTGLTTFRQAMDTSVGAQIAQRIVSEAQETDFQILLASASLKDRGEGAQFFRLPLRYFDEQGNETKDPGVASAAERLRILYTVRVRGSKPGSANVSNHSSSYFTSLPDVDGKRFNPRDMTILSIQVATNPAIRNVDDFVDENTFLIDGDKARRAGIAVQNYSVALARNGFTGTAPPSPP